MEIGGIREVVYATSDLDAAIAWWRDVLGLWFVEADGERAVFEAGDSLRVVLDTKAPAGSVVVGYWSLGDGAPQRGTSTDVIDPGGHHVRLHAPPAGDGGAAIEARLTEFIEGAEPLAGPAVATLADGITAVVADAAERIGALIDGVAHNKILATQLLQSQRARQVEEGSDDQWRLSAASTLLSPTIIPPSERR
jgi:catechol 2,3-dioxygenase-like lactoylglutathione lyase family enzyme